MINLSTEEAAFSDCVFFTIVARNYLSYAISLSQSISKTHPGARVFVALSDKGSEVQSNALFETISVEQLNLPALNRFAFRYDVMEFSTAIKPYVFNFLMSRFPGKAIIYLDPDILVVAPLVSVIERLRSGVTAVLTPHITVPIEDSFEPNEITMLRVGVYNLGFIGIGVSEESRKLVAWWCSRLEFGAYVDLESGLFTDQKWADLMPSLFSDVVILRESGYNVAYWNLMSRSLSFVGGRYLVDDQEVSFFHFSGIDLTQPNIFSKHQNRFTAADLGVLRPLYDLYIKNQYKNGYREYIRIPYGYGCLQDGTKINAAMRRYFRGREHLMPADPFKVLTSSYFNEAEIEFGCDSPLTRMMTALHSVQRELQQEFNLKKPEDRVRYRDFFLTYGKDFYGVGDEFLNMPVTLKTGAGIEAGILGKVLRLVICQVKRYFPSTFDRLAGIIPEKIKNRLKYRNIKR